MGVENRSVLVLSVESVSRVEHYSDLSEDEQALWCEKHTYLLEEGKDPEALYVRRAAVEAEFARVIAIGLGFLRIRDRRPESLRIEVLQQEDEKALLNAFLAALPEDEGALRYNLCAHNGREFDFPFLCRRLLSQDFDLPLPLQIQGKKPWELQHIKDTFDMWHFGDRKHFTSLRVLCYALSIPMKKVLMDTTGTQIHALYYKNKDLGTIHNYVAAQVAATAEVYVRLQQLQPLSQETISVEAYKKA